MGSRCEITSVLTEEQGTLPILVEFEHGAINPSHTKDLQCNLYRDPNNFNNKILSVTNDKTMYRGTTEESKKRFCTYLAIRNRKTNKVQLVQMESVRACPVLEKNKPEPSDNVDGAGLETKPKDYKKEVLDLSRVFGSKVSKRIEEQKLRLKVAAKADNKLKGSLKDKIAEAELAAANPDYSLKNLLPPCNTIALYPKDVYSLSDILNEEEVSSLEEAYVEMSKEEDFLSKCSTFFRSLQDVCEGNVRSLAYLLYAEYLIQLCNKVVVNKLYQICDASEIVATRMQKEFTVAKGSSRVVPSAERDKVALRVIIIGLIIGKFQLNILTLNDSLMGVNLSRLKILARVTGATLIPKSDLCILKVPLPKLKLSTGKKNKRRR